MISDSSPIIFLSKIGKLKLLNDLFGFVNIPEAVKSEILKKDKPGFLAIEKALDEKWIQISNPKTELNIDIGKGERSAISLAVEKKDSLIMDDSFGIKIANSLNIPTFRTTSIIFMAVNKKKISKKEAKLLIGKLIDEGYYISPKYYSLIIDRLN